MATTISEVTRRRGLALTLLLTCQLMLMLDVTVMNVALPRIRTDLGFSLAGLGFTSLNVVIMGTVPPADAGAAGGAMQTMQQLGSTLGLAVVVTVAGAASRPAQATGAASDEVLVAGMNDAFLAAACFAALTVVVAFLFRRGAR